MPPEDGQFPLGGLVPGDDEPTERPTNPRRSARRSGAVVGRAESAPRAGIDPAVAPLADRMRPGSLDEVVGQPHLTGPDGAFRAFLSAERIPSIVLWGPPGTGKTTLARVLGRHPGYVWEQFSAVLSGVKDVREVVARAAERLSTAGQRTLLFVDEIHRFNRSQQDAFLPHVEAGTITLIGATTENPSFQVNPALLSRCRVYVLRDLDDEALAALATRALSHLGNPFRLSSEAVSLLVRLAEGDARRILLSVETLAQIAPQGGELDVDAVDRCLQTGTARNLGSEDHFNWISALHKSVRGSDPHAAVYWITQMLQAGEDPRYIARRLVRMASEDIGLAEPGALQMALTAREAYELLGSPEGHLALAQCAVYLALCPKSDSVYRASGRARALLEERGSRPVPPRLRNAPTGLMRELGYGRGYQSAQRAPGRFLAEDYLPDDYREEPIYQPSEEGREQRMVEDHRRRTHDHFRLRSDTNEAGPAASSASDETNG